MSSIGTAQSTSNRRATREPGGKRSGLDRPIAIYEVDLGSWMRVPEQNNRPLTCAELAPKLTEYVRRLNFTHVELLSTVGHPLHNGLGEARLLINHLHEHNLGVVLDGMPLDAGAHHNGNTAVNELHVDGVRTGDVVSMRNGGFAGELKWDADWSRGLLDYFRQDPIDRKFYQEELASRTRRAPTENLILPLSHDEVTDGHGSLLGRMPGDEWQKFANLRLLYACMIAQPGKKLLFMGGEFGQWNEWKPDTSLDWHLVQDGNHHAMLQRWVAELNRCYGQEPALHQTDANPEGFEWIDGSDADGSTLSWLRKDPATGEAVLAAFNFTPVPRHNYRVGAPCGGYWTELLNSDALEYGGSGQGNLGGVEAAPFGWHFKSHSVTITLPPLGAVFFKHIG
jgi:1,4-alpha-glucan branching enzyme